MKMKLYLLSFISMSLLSGHSNAVQIGQQGTGQVLIYPYYTVNNDINTLYSVVNTTDQPKAVRVRFLEGEIGRDVLSFNVYLSPFDVWTGALAPKISTISGHIGEPSLTHITVDTSCAPFLVKAGQEFLPFLIDADAPNNSLNRAREGHIEIIEMGGVVGDAAEAIDHGTVGIPFGCNLLENDWADNGEWDFDELGDPTGGLLGSVSLINVAEGLNFSYDAIALDNFWDEDGLHTAPGNPLPDLSSGSNESRVLLSNGELAVSEWSTGFEAVSALLMKTEVYNEYAYDTVVNCQSDWVMSFPTKIYHTDVDGNPIAPFNDNWDGNQSCDASDLIILDNEAQLEISNQGCTMHCPPPQGPQWCYSSNVMEIIAPDALAEESSRVLASDNFLSFTAPSEGVVESGWASVDFSFNFYDNIGTKIMTPVTGTGYKGLPVTGFMVQEFTNSAAASGLIAQYGGLFMHKGLVDAGDLGVDLVFRNAFD